MSLVKDHEQFQIFGCILNQTTPILVDPKDSQTQAQLLLMQSYVLRDLRLYINYYISVCAVLAAQTDGTTRESKLLGPRKTAVHLHIKVLEFSTEVTIFTREHRRFENGV